VIGFAKLIRKQTGRVFESHHQLQAF